MKKIMALVINLVMISFTGYAHVPAAIRTEALETLKYFNISERSNDQEIRQALIHAVMNVEHLSIDLEYKEVLIKNLKRLLNYYEKPIKEVVTERNTKSIGEEKKTAAA